MADLESMTNKELHNLCIEKGLPNIPVTDTSRKIIIKRLTNAMADEKKEKAKARRETIHVIHVEKEEEVPKKPSKSAGRRTTMGVPQTAKETKDPDPPVVEKSQPTPNRRRSTRASPMPESNEPVKAAPKKTSKAPVIEEDDEDDVMIVEEEDTRRKSRSPSLTKSEVVRTYFKSSVVAEPVVEEHNGEVKVEEEEYQPLPPTVISRRPRFSPTPTTRISPAKSTTITRSNVEQTSFDDAPIKPVLERQNLERHYEESSRKPYLYPDLRSSFANAYEEEKNSYMDRDSRSKVDNLYEEKSHKSTYEEKPSYLSRDTAVYSSKEVPSYIGRHSTAYYDTERLSNLYSTNTKPSESLPSYSRNFDDKNTVTTTQTTNRRLVSNFYPETNYSSLGGANKRKAYTEHSDDYEEEEEEEDNEPKIEAPHFQHFARRLSALREQEISSILNKDTKPKDYRSRYEYRYPSTYRKNEGVMDRMVSYWRILDKKYNVSFYLIVVGIILALAFVYIFFSN